MLKRLFFIAFVAFSTAVSAQNVPIEPCGYDRIMEVLEQQYPGFRANYDQQYLQTLGPKKVTSRKTPIKDTILVYDTVFTIPVVYHVLYNNAAENLHDSLLLNQLEVLNQDFRRLNADTFKTRAAFKSRAGDVRIEFVLAAKNPAGDPTTGIIRKYTDKTTFFSQSLADMKYSQDGGDDAWDPHEYLNIWVCDLSFQGQDNLLGFAYPPYGHPFWTQQSWVQDPHQGVVLHYKVTGRNNPLSNSGVLLTSKKGRVATHEVGHFLGLRHIWGDATSGSGCAVDDYIFDTPNQANRSNFNCNLNMNTCSDNGTELPDMVENYMDYSSHDCQNIFTRQQVLAMRSSLVDFRTSLPISMEIKVSEKVIDTFKYDQIKIFASQGQKVIVEVRNEDLKDNLKMDVLDMTGQAVMKDVTIGKNENWLNTSNLSSGVYFFHLKKQDNHSIKIEKLLITKN